MKRVLRGSAILVCLLAIGCTSSKERADEAQAEYTEEKTKTVQEYKECVKDAEGDEGKLKECEALLKAVEALEGAK